MSEYIAGVQLSREQIRAKNKETLMELINNGQIPDTEKQAAIQSMIRMTEISEKEMRRRPCSGPRALWIRWSASQRTRWMWWSMR